MGTVYSKKSTDSMNEREYKKILRDLDVLDRKFDKKFQVYEKDRDYLLKKLGKTIADNQNKE